MSRAAKLASECTRRGRCAQLLLASTAATAPAAGCYGRTLRYLILIHDWDRSSFICSLDLTPPATAWLSSSAAKAFQHPPTAVPQMQPAATRLATQKLVRLDCGARSRSLDLRHASQD